LEICCIGVDLADVKAASLKVEKVSSEGTGVKVRNADVSGDTDLRDIQAGKGGTSRNP
jgi:hypothetical protein